ncbi:DUF6969 family protein [Ferrovibrio xuzhouensis]|uniref:DUF6969 family protein n=1 Tax=Ferrovibrio xuzhouensis TaxID=1576914 RepID=A0ABV7VI23_9PROT
MSQQRQTRLAVAADIFLSVLSEAARDGRHVIIDLIGDAPFTQLAHYPAEDVHDTRSGALYFYHAHAPEDRAGDEHGHFHCFVERSKLTSAAAPVARPKAKYSGKQLCHLIAISIDRRGVPVELFTTNQWVTDEWLYPADEVIPLIEHFVFSDEGEMPLASRWLASFVALYRPVIAQLLRERDTALEIGTGGSTSRCEDLLLEIPSRRTIDIDRQISDAQQGVSETP